MKKMHSLFLALATGVCMPIYADDGTIQSWFGGGGDGEDVVTGGVWTFDRLSEDQQDVPIGCDNAVINTHGELLTEHGWFPSFGDKVSPRIEFLDPYEFTDSFSEVGGGTMRFYSEWDSILPFQFSMMMSPVYLLEDTAIDQVYPEIRFFAQSLGDTPTLYYWLQCSIFDPDGYPIGGGEQFIPVEDGMNEVRVSFPDLVLAHGNQVQAGIGLVNEGKQEVANRGPALDKVKVDLKKQDAREWKFVPDIMQEGATCQGTAFANCLSWWANQPAPNGYPELAPGDTQAEKNEKLRKELVKRCHTDNKRDIGVSQYLSDKKVYKRQAQTGNRPQLEQKRYGGSKVTWAKVKELFDAGGDVLLRLGFYNSTHQRIGNAAHYITVARVEETPKKRIRAANPWGPKHDVVNNENKDSSYDTFDVTEVNGKIRLKHLEFEDYVTGLKDCQYLCVTHINVIRQVAAAGDNLAELDPITVDRTDLKNGFARYDYTVNNITDHNIEFITLNFDVPLENSQGPVGWWQAPLPWPYPDAEDCGDFAGGNGLQWSTSTSPIAPGESLSGFSIEVANGFPHDEETALMSYLASNEEGTWELTGGPLSRLGDLNDDGNVDGTDLAIALGSWGICVDCVADLNGDGVVDGADLATVLGGWTG